MKWILFSALKWLNDKGEASEMKARYYAQQQEQKETKERESREKKNKYLNSYYSDYDKIRK